VNEHTQTSNGQILRCIQRAEPSQQRTPSRTLLAWPRRLKMALGSARWSDSHFEWCKTRNVTEPSRNLSSPRVTCTVGDASIDFKMKPSGWLLLGLASRPEPRGAPTTRCHDTANTFSSSRSSDRQKQRSGRCQRQRGMRVARRNSNEGRDGNAQFLCLDSASSDALSPFRR
jgi:hypothetical protein